MPALSIVIVCKNEAGVIGSTLSSLDGITDDIIVYDNGSTDNTMDIIKKFPVHLYTGEWEGFGRTKNKANQHARYDWILSLDADEAADDELKRSLATFDDSNEKSIYKIRFRNFLGKKAIKYGEWGRDWHTRLFNRKAVSWDEEPVHEKLIMPEGFVMKKLKGFLLHRTAENISEYAAKTVKYALLNAEKYYRRGQKSSWFKIRVAPAFNFFHYFILKAGFLDGHAGYICAKMTAHYTFLKYARLRELNKKADNR
jgi:glycosyltransferase involved in cell wall biosynthesis